MGFPGGSTDKESACNVGDLGLIPGLKSSPEKGIVPTAVLWPGESMNCIVHGITKSRKRLSNLHSK